MNLNKILATLQQYKVSNRKEVLTQAIQERLAQSLSTYYKELDKSLSYLSQKNEVKLMKKINHINEDN